MGKRIKRIFSSDLNKITTEVGIGYPINVVLRNNQTFFGKFLTYENGTLSIADGRDRSHKFATSDIDQIVFDLIEIR